MHIIYNIQPFLKEKSTLDKYFPDKYWALVIPAYGASLVYTMCFILLGWIFILSYREKNSERKESFDNELKKYHQKNQ